MTTITNIELSAADIFQILDALNTRAEAYQQTAYFMSGQCDTDTTISMEECRDAIEAQEIAQHFRDIIKSIEDQISKKRSC
jgi:hypothetical protein